MNPQPDVNTIAQAFAASSTALATASQEIALVPNMPVFNNGQNILAAIQHLSTNIDNLRNDVTTLTTTVTTLTTNVNTLTADFNTLRTDVNTLRTDFNTLNTKFDGLELRMRAESAYFSPFSNFIIMTFYSSLNHTARVYNSHISSQDTPLRVLHDRRNAAVAGFPIDSASLTRLSSQIKSHIEELFHQTNIMTGETLTTLLNAFELPSNGTVKVKKTRFREFIGVVVDV